MNVHGLLKAESIRWTANRKYEVLAAIVAGRLSVDEACRNFHTSPEELGEWWRAACRRGICFKAG